jgi:hypothetical protein
LSKSITTQTSSNVIKNLKKLHKETKAEALLLQPSLSNELEIAIKAYSDIQVLPCDRLTNHYDHFKFENASSNRFFYLTTRDICYGEYWKVKLLEKIQSQNYQLLKTGRKYNKKAYYVSSFIEKIKLLDGETEIDTTPNDYLTEDEYNGYCRPNNAEKNKSTFTE